MGKLELVIESDNVSIYSPKYDGETQTEFEKFMSDNGELENPQSSIIFLMPSLLPSKR